MFAAFSGDSTMPETVEYQDAAAYAHDIIGDLNAGMNRWIDWNICVAKTAVHAHVSMGFAAPIVANEDGTYRKTISFDYIRHFSKYILPGAVRIASTQCDDTIEMTAAKNPDGSLVAVLLNKTAKDRSYAIRLEGKVIRVKAPAHTIGTVCDWGVKKIQLKNDTCNLSKYRNFGQPRLRLPETLCTDDFRTSKKVLPVTFIRSGGTLSASSPEIPNPLLTAPTPQSVHPLPWQLSAGSFPPGPLTPGK